MFKKIVTASALLFAAAQVATASPYLGVSTGVRTTTTTYSSFRGMPGTVFAGYGANMGLGFYMAGEVYGAIGTATITSNNGLKATYNYGLSLIPGLMLSDHTMAFGRLGVGAGYFSGGGGASGTPTNVHIGLGLQTGLTQNWDVRLEYTYFASQSVAGISGSPSTDAATLGLVYRLD